MTGQSGSIVVVGAGHGGTQAASLLRQLGFDGAIALIGNEPDPPYDRPPLSKDYLSGEKSFDRLYLRAENFWQDQRIELVLGSEVVALDPARRRLTFADGGGRDFGRLIWAAGGEPRRLSCPGHDLAGIHVIRRRADVDAILAELPQVRRVVVIGGGYIGLEAAAVMSKLGRQVVLLEALDRVLARVAGEDLSRFFEAEHRRQGVDVRTAARVEGLEGEKGRVVAVRLADGESVPADLVVVGIGILPLVRPLLRAGAAGDNGVLVDEYCRTSLDHVYAIGDCAAHANPFADGAVIRLESIQNANDQAMNVARHLTGNPQPYRATPWFWSNQYDLRLQTVGLSIGHDQVVRRGDPSGRSFSIVYLKRGRVIALDCINQVRDYSHGRKLVEIGAEPDLARLADGQIALKDLL